MSAVGLVDQTPISSALTGSVASSMPRRTFGDLWNSLWNRSAAGSGTSTVDDSTLFRSISAAASADSAYDSKLPEQRGNYYYDPDYPTNPEDFGLNPDGTDILGKEGFLTYKPDANTAKTVYAPAPQKLAYQNADLASAYGMDATTAYQEALANTSYQRAVKDLQAAGLNPALLYSSLSGAGGVSRASTAGSSYGSSSAKSADSWYGKLKNVFTAASPILRMDADKAAKVGGAIGNILDDLGI